MTSNPSDQNELLLRRRQVFAPNCSIAYDDPLVIVRGDGQYLYDDRGRQFLDCVNNVCHVGHSRPEVVEAIARQAAILNTNTRYLHPKLGEYCDRLLEKFPAPLSVVYLVCSGSEAVDLALRLAYAASGARHTICLNWAYHGHSDALIGISPYKFARAGGDGCPSTTRVVSLPDIYRGEHTGDDAGALYAAEVGAAIKHLAENGLRPAAFIAEAAPGCAGQIQLPKGYFEPAFSAIRAAGGVAIVDEVQTGFGRPGESFWAFENQDCVPDIVTLGKPIGNGHPMAAVITTADVARAFNSGMEFFATFGGNPVSLAAGLAVLDVIERDQLQDHALDVGNYLLHGLTTLAKSDQRIGDVRGRGLFIGIDMVSDPQLKTPDAAIAHWLVNALRHRGILLSTDGPFNNVLKFKPPMVFTRENANELLGALKELLASDVAA